MDIARLSLVLSLDAARRQINQMQADLFRLDQVAGTIGRRMSGSINTAFTQMTAGSRAATQAFAVLETQAAQTFTTIGRGATFSVSGMTSLDKTAQSLTRTFLAFFGAAQFIKFGRESIQASLDFERTANVLKLVTGSAGEAAEQFAFLQRETDRIGIDFRESANAFAKFEAAARGTGVTTAQLKETFITVAEAGRRFGLTTENQGRIFRALEQMISKGTVSMEELRQQLGDALPGAFQIAARAMGMTGKEFNKLVSAGDLMTKDFLGPFTKELAKMAPAAETVTSTAAEINRLTNAWDRFKASVGQSIPVGNAAKAGTAILNQFNPRDAARDAETRDIATGMGFDFNKRRGIFGGDSQKEKQIMDAAVAEMDRRLGLRSATGDAVRGLGEAVGSAADGFGGSFSGLFSAPTSKQATKLNKFTRGLTDDGLGDRDALIQRYENQKEAVKEMGLTWRQEAEAIDAVNKARDRAVGKFDTDKALKEETEASKELSDAYLKNQDALEKFTFEGLEPAETAAAKANAEYRKQYLQLIQLDEAGGDVTETMEALRMAYGRQTDEISKRRNKAGFSGESFGSLMGGIKSDERSILTETDAEAFEETSRRIGDRHAELTRRMKANTLSVQEAWTVGWEQAAERMGTFNERVVAGTGQLAQSMDESFTEGFSAMILGTKSVTEAFSQMATSIVSDLVRIMVQQLIVRQVIQGISMIGSIGSLGGAGATATGGAGTTAQHFANIRGAYHFGGVVSAERFHEGGVTGDEVPVIARRGETIFTPEQMNAFGRVIASNMKSGGGQKVEIVNVSSESDFVENLYRNQSAILNIIGSNSKKVRRMTIGS